MPTTISYGLVVTPVSSGGSVATSTGLVTRTYKGVLKKSILGRGFAYPFQLNVDGSAPLMVAEEDVIRADMMNLLETRTGERPYCVKNGQPYGTRIADGLFENEVIAKDIIPYEVTRALNLWEPRIVVQGIDVVSTPAGKGAAKIQANIRFTYRATNRADNLVKPYFVGSRT